MSSISVSFFFSLSLFCFHFIKRFLSIEMLPVIYFFTTGAQSCISPAATKAHFICSKIIGKGISLSLGIQSKHFHSFIFACAFSSRFPTLCALFAFDLHRSPHSHDVQTMASNLSAHSSFIIFQMIDFHFFSFLLKRKNLVSYPNSNEFLTQWWAQLSYGNPLKIHIWMVNEFSIR